MVYCSYILIYFATGERISSRWCSSFLGKLFFNFLKMPCVKVSKNADPSEEEKPLNKRITGKKTAKIVEHKRYKKTIITDAETKLQEIKNIDKNDKM